MVTRENSRSGSAEERLKELGIELPAPPEPFGTCVEAVQAGNLLFLSVMLPTEGRLAKFVGRVGAASIELTASDSPRLNKRCLLVLRQDSATRRRS
jgi:hypothetical protein